MHYDNPHQLTKYYIFFNFNKETLKGPGARLIHTKAQILLETRYDRV